MKLGIVVILVLMVVCFFLRWLWMCVVRVDMFDSSLMVMYCLRSVVLSLNDGCMVSSCVMRGCFVWI